MKRSTSTMPSMEQTRELAAQVWEHCQGRLPGSTHDVTALRTSGLLDTEHTTLHLADRGYQGTVLLTPIKKRPGQPLNDHDRAFNASLNRIRATVERVIANLKTWRVLHTDYRRPHATHATTLTAILGIIFTYHLN